MDQSERILDAVQDLALSTGQLPSIVQVAAKVGLTKQGVLHYFPTRAALDRAVVVRAVARVDAAMSTAAAAGRSPGATYLRLSAPEDGDRAAAVVIAAAVRRGESLVPSEVDDAVARWEGLIAEEVGDPVRAEVVRLVGDGLFAEALVSGRPPDPERVTRIVEHLLGATPEGHA
jgi:AcrR family transcriptional regulator